MVARKVRLQALIPQQVGDFVLPGSYMLGGKFHPFFLKERTKLE
jgi:hypothetical protein